MTQRFGKNGPALHQAGWPVIPVLPKSKAAVEEEWEKGFSLERIKAFAANGYAGGNTGLLAKHFPGGDIDVPDKACVLALVKAMHEALGPAPIRVGAAPKCLLMYMTSEPFKKRKVFLADPQGNTKGPDGKAYAVEFLGDGQQYLIYGQHPGGFEYRWPRGGGPAESDVWDLTEINAAKVDAFIANLPAVLPAGWTVREVSIGPNTTAGDAFEHYKPPVEGWDVDRVMAEVLPHLDPDCGYEAWLRVGQALHHQGGGDFEWLNAWDVWSQGSGKYTEGLCARKWDSFTANRAAESVTLASLLAETKEARGVQRQAASVDAVATHRSAIEAATTELTVREVCARIAMDGAVDALSRETLVGVIQNKLRDINGVKPGVVVVRGMVALSRVVAQGPVIAPDWARPWCYVTGEAKFFNRNTKELITREAFDSAYGRFMEPDDDGNVPQPSRLACDTWEIPIVYDRMYMPSAGELFTLDGKEYANNYRPESEPIGIADPAINLVLMRHFELLIPDPVYRRQFLEWAAWVVRNPGKKVLWAVLVKGVEGDGKSALGSMIAQAMGHANVGLISPETLAGSNFNDWAVGRCVNVLEEIKMQGHNRHDVYNKIKPLITNPRIEVHGKGKASTTAVNTTNYIGFTNHDDALPLDDKDRRHFVLFTPWRDIGEMHAAIVAMGLTVEAYWDQLWDAIKNRPEAVRGFFDGIDIAEFNPNSRAPATTHKQALVAAGDLDDAESLARFWIEEGCYGVSKTVVSSRCLTKALGDMTPPVQMHTSRVRKMLEGLGYETVPGQVKWKGYPHRVWVHRASVNSEVKSLDGSWLRAELDKTDLGGAEDFLK